MKSIFVVCQVLGTNNHGFAYLIHSGVEDRPNAMYIVRSIAGKKSNYPDTKWFSNAKLEFFT